VDLLQQTPLAVIVAPPLSGIAPPLDAVEEVINVIVAVVTVGVVEVVKLESPP
jgi:hypothetical protein